MFISKYSKCYDTSDGSEQQFDDPAIWIDDTASGADDRPARRTQAAGQAAHDRWEDDGAPLVGPDLVFVEDSVLSDELTEKPARSVLSLADLNEAIRRGRRADNPERLRQQTERNRRAGVRALEIREDALADAARAHHDRHRNAWEHT